MTDYPLTSNQQLIWAEQQLHPDRVLYVVAQMVRFDGEIDPDRFERALCALVAATDALRFVVIEERGTPRQHAEPTLPVCLLHLDFSAAVDPDAALHAWAEAEMEQPFPRGLMFASALARLGRDRWAWFYRVHHLVFDGASATLLARRMSMLYEAAGDGEPPVPTYPRLEEYIASQTAYEATADAEVARQYWADRMNEPAERWRVCRPAGRPRGPGIVRSVQAIEADDLRRLDEVARLLHPGVANLDAARVNVLTALAAATAWRLIGPDVLPIGTLFGNRPHGAHAALVGFLSTTGVLRVDVGAGSSLGSLAAAIREQYVEARRHSRICARNAGPGAFDLLVNYFRWAPTMPFAGRTAELEMLTAGQAGCGAALQFKASADGRELLWHLDLNPHEFDDTARAGFIELFGRVLGSGLRSPEAPIASLARVAPSAGDNLLAGEVTAPAVAVIDAVLARACGAPSTTAVEQDGRRVTYAELRRNLERVAATLRAYGVAPGEVVAIAMPRGLEQVTAVLGVLRAGAACLPIDVQWPVERCRAVAVAAGARYAIAGHGNATTFAGVASIVDPGRMQAAPTTVDGEPPGSAATTSAGEPLNAAVTDSCAGQLKPAPARPDVAFVFATSGTTGAPRAVELSHAGIANHVAAMGDRCGISATDRVLQFASPAFDTAVEETLMALTRGATLVLRSEGTLGSARTFLQACERWRISVLDLPTSLWHTLVEDGAGWPATVRLVIIGGEAARPELVGAWSRGPGRRIRLLNSYGPTEASIAPLCTDLSGWCADRHVPIGRPIANVHAYVVDRAGVPVPRGLPGELVIGGAAVARGYRSNADDTRERFTADQWLPGGRVYRTGDRVRVNGDGDVEFIGRLDGQVKIRGYRIEPAEIEARLERHPSVRAAAVVAVRTEDELALTAFVEGPPSDAGGALLGWVRAALPASMIPARIVVLADLPRTAGGKVDRPVLSALTTLPPRPPQRPLGTAVERWIARIWSDVLHVPVTDADAHFFELGGHSLSVMRTVARLEEDFRIAVPPSLVFECPTIGLMAAALHRAAAGAPVERIADLLLQIDAMSDAEVEAALLGAHVHDH